ncbi:ROK family transcriptional regulator [Actinoplanes subtropicus]|uniref:ROK family transcriptional regulator n=1 Tax=Actinoplanes subtropicus TaxID=543632 RepID=UPI0004C4232A|nr:ROK family transcriptional regulator [Actinoplanes subtropicus]
MKRTSRDIRVANRFEVLRRILGAGPVARQEIAADTGLSLATVSNLVGELLQADLLEEVGYQDSGGGRPRALVAVRRSAGMLAGVDVAETYVHVEIFDTALRVLASVEEPLHPSQESSPAQIVAHIVSSLRAAADRAGVGPEGLMGVGVSVPGQIDRAGGVSVFAPNWDWHDVPLRAQLAEHIGVPLYLDNPLRAGVLAELWFGAGRGRDDVAVLTLGTGVGAGLAVRGQLYRGATNSAGEWGHTNLVMDGRPCRCGSHGCVEAYVGAPGIMARLREIAPDSPLLRPGDQTATIDALASAYHAGDPVATAVVAETARYLAVAIADLINILNPEVVVLSSWVAAKLGEPLLARARALLGRHALSRPLANTEIVLCRIEGNPVSLGAATFALEGYLERIGGQVTAAATRPRGHRR